MVLGNTISDKLANNHRGIDYFSWFVSIYLINIPFIGFNNKFSAWLGFDSNYLTYAYYGVLWLLLIISFRRLFPKIRSSFLLFVLISLLFIICNILIYPENRIYITGDFFKNIPTFSATCILSSMIFLWIGACVTDYSSLRKKFHIASRIGIIFAVLSDIIALFILQEKYYDDMSFGYGVCLVTCDALFEYLQGRKKTDLIFSLVGIISILISGTRGPVLCVMILFVLWTFIYQKKVKYRVEAIVGCIVLVLLNYLGVFYRLLEKLSLFLQSIGIQDNRIMNMLFSGEIWDSSGRDDLFSTIWESIMQRPMLGYGIGGDRLLLQNNSYVHNIILELFCDFGIIFGSIIFIYLMWLFIKSILEKNSDFSGVCLIIFSVTVLKLMMSSSYIISPILFLLIGMCLNHIPEKASLSEVEKE